MVSERLAGWWGHSGRTCPRTGLTRAPGGDKCGCCALTSLLELPQVARPVCGRNAFYCWARRLAGAGDTRARSGKAQVYFWA